MTRHRPLPVPTPPPDRLAALETRLGALPSPAPFPRTARAAVTQMLMQAVLISASLLVSLASVVCLLAWLW
jgi:hypothetical protein